MSRYLDRGRRIKRLFAAGLPITRAVDGRKAR
jgi:hypothetical protein